MKLSKMNLGTTRLPRGENRDSSIEIVRHAIDSGMRFVDASRGYWDIELLLAKALKNGYREKVLLSSKWAPWMMKIEEDDGPTESCTIKRIEESLTRLDTDYLDYFLIWSQTEKIDSLRGMIDGLFKARELGLVRKIGFSSHDSEKNILDNLKTNYWTDIIILSYNILNRSYSKALEFAHSKGIETLIMNPLGGGSFLRENQFMLSIAEKVGAKSIPELALRFAVSNKNIDGILNGISSIEDIDSCFEVYNKGIFNSYQLKIIDEEINTYKNVDGFCTSCHYCMPCPKRIDIPSVMQSIFIENFTNDKEKAKENYNKISGKKADECIFCGKCEKKCTQNLKIMNGMKYAAKEYSSF